MKVLYHKNPKAQGYNECSGSSTSFVTSWWELRVTGEIG